MNRFAYVALIAAAFLLLLGLGLAGGVILDRAVLAAFLPLDDIPANAKSDFGLIAEAWNLLQRNYVDRPALESRSLTYGAISGMVDSLGDTGHSRFLTPEMVKEQNKRTSGQFEGIGAYLDIRDGQVVIVAPIDGSPAQQAGLRAGDIILRVDGQEVSGLSPDEVVGRILGPKGTSVTLLVFTPETGETRDVTIIRAEIQIKNVIWQVLPGCDVADVRIVAFSQGVSQDLELALAEIQRQSLKGIILDLRNNPGGLLDEAIGTASQFLAGGNVLLVKDALGQETPVQVKEGGQALDIPMVVLVNQGTASAAEIVSGAIQDAGRAKLVGETTFGTGTVLSQFPLSDGSAVLLATQLWLTPAGRVIWKQGIVPDETVPLPADATPLAPDPITPITDEDMASTTDSQLLRALDIVGASSMTRPVSSPNTVLQESESKWTTKLCCH